MAGKTVSIGHRFGKLTIVDRAPAPRVIQTQVRWWMCKCDCGREKVVAENNLTSKGKGSKSCGCLKRKYDNVYSEVGEDVFVSVRRIADGELVAVIVIDKADREAVERHWWSINSQGYPQTMVGKGKRTYLKLHQLLAGKRMDHADQNRLNNRRNNIRPATQSQNGANRNKFKGEYTSKFKGVYFHRDSGRWCSLLSVAGKRYSKRHHSEDEAARAYDAAAVKHFGEFAVLNFP